MAEHALRKRTVVGSIPTGGCRVGHGIDTDGGALPEWCCHQTRAGTMASNSGASAQDKHGDPCVLLGSHQGRARWRIRPVPHRAATALAAHNVAAPAHMPCGTQRSNSIPCATDHHQLAVWSSGMIRASGARGPGLNSRNGPCCSQCMTGALCACSAPAHAR